MENQVTRPTLPYFAPADTLPAPLPTVAEILASKRLCSPYRPNVVRVGEHFVVKFGEYVHLQEGENILFVAQSTSIPVATVYAIFHDKDTNKNFIIQEFVPGNDLDQVWQNLDETAKDAIATQLRRDLDELRSLPSPGYFGGIWRQPARDRYMEGGGFGCDILQTVKDVATEAEWVDAMLSAGQLAKPLDKEGAEFNRRMYHGVFCGHGDSVFTHGDLHMGNIRLRPDGVVVMVDWGWSGWYPCYWEVGTAALWRPKTDGYHRYVARFLDEYPAQMGWMMLFRMWLFF
ncbi:kinase-like protein [Coniochaeta ligniaria NRRL 30616]|uniref:Kinase-like protein n=1 Tax=Coniochaeta ligniaria NRRL 30616 TaxID=1408157 RepID=A0A1J7IH37_9PEZI|nr:kinase-like protein [Coniochaeta ligniaria NRRL 30616]